MFYVCVYDCDAYARASLSQLLLVSFFLVVAGGVGIESVVVVVVGGVVVVGCCWCCCGCVCGCCCYCVPRGFYLLLMLPRFVFVCTSKYIDGSTVDSDNVSG